MKKYLIIIGLLLFAIIGYYYFSSSTLFHGISTKSFVKILPDSESQFYTGIDGYGTFFDFQQESVPIDPDIYDISKYKFPSGPRGLDFPKQNAYAFVYTYDIDKTITVQNSIVVIDKSTKKVNEYFFPSTSDRTYTAKVGDNIFVMYLHRLDYTRRPNLSDYQFYIFNIADRKFYPLVVDQDFGSIWYQFYVIPNPNNGNIFGIGYCSKQGWDDCAEFSVAISDSHVIKTAIRVRMPFTIGWKDDNLFVKKDNKVYLVNPNKLQ
jgi:hypothetical protein